MLRRFLIAAAVVAVVASAAVGAAAASGPAPAGKQTFDVSCGSLGSFTVSLPTSQQNNGAAQVVGASGHFIGVSFTFTITDVTTGSVLFSDTSSVGGGNAHPNQSTVTCSVVLFEAPASEALPPGVELPPGVAPTDILRATGTAVVIPKL